DQPHQATSAADMTAALDAVIHFSQGVDKSVDNILIGVDHRGMTPIDRWTTLSPPPAVTIVPTAPVDSDRDGDQCEVLASTLSTPPTTPTNPSRCRKEHQRFTH